MKPSRIVIIAVLVMLVIAVVTLSSHWPRGARNDVTENSTPPPISKTKVTSLPVAGEVTQNAGEHAPRVSPSPPPEPLSGFGQVAPLVLTEGWKNVGRATVGTAIQSQFWAIAQGDIDYLQRTTMLDESVRRSLERLLEQVPAGVRSEYPTPEALAAFLLASRPALKGYALSLQKTASSDETSVDVMTLLPGADRFDGERQNFRRGADGEWYRAIGVREVSYWREMVKWDKELSKSRKWSQPR